MAGVSGAVPGLLCRKGMITNLAARTENKKKRKMT